ncbi:hypothetical protein BK126_17675 [Paenibacillus sp. FSL H7-0326]|uniref:hypothetical protein n=1 Tax=Paenibacillus sp. FSL H7-0326 TaxID=1921144 RepID=UPI00096E2620|nr:hypothetical protein [Paenibacillus sp. FSL H7-0326]OMC67421.1 hypothetical protein BK126_17675 [Paenibacillus sp. FSL H7-0326]
MSRMMNNREFIEMTVKEERSVVLRVKDHDELVRGVSKLMNDHCLFIDSEEGNSLKYEMDDIIEVFAIQSLTPSQMSVQTHLAQSTDSDDELEILVQEFNGLTEDHQLRLTTRLSQIFKKDVLISTSELETYSLAEICMLTDIINGYILTVRTPNLLPKSIHTMNLPSKIEFGLRRPLEEE